MKPDVVDVDVNDDVVVHDVDVGDEKIVAYRRCLTTLQYRLRYTIEDKDTQSQERLNEVLHLRGPVTQPKLGSRITMLS